MSVSDYSSRNKDLAFGTKNFDYMPSHRSERKRYSFSLLSQPSKAQLLRVHQSSVIKSYITRSAKKGFNYNGEATSSLLESRVYASAARPLPPSVSVSSPPSLAPPKQITTTIPSSPGPVPPPPSSPPPLSAPPSEQPILVSSVEVDNPPLSPTSKPIPISSVEEDKFAYRCLRAIKLAAAARVAIRTEETHIWARIQEEELVLGMLHDEAEDTSSKMKTASHQLTSIYEGAKLYGVALPDIEEIEQEVVRSQGQSESPAASPRTPPGQLFHELIVDVMNRSTSGHSQEPPELSSLASTSSLLFQVPPVITTHSDLPGPSQFPLNGQSSSQMNPSYPASPPPSILLPQAGTTNREGKRHAL